MNLSVCGANERSLNSSCSVKKAVLSSSLSAANWVSGNFAAHRHIHTYIHIHLVVCRKKHSSLHTGIQWVWKCLLLHSPNFFCFLKNIHNPKFIVSRFKLHLTTFPNCVVSSDIVILWLIKYIKEKHPAREQERKKRERSEVQTKDNILLYVGQTTYIRLQEYNFGQCEAKDVFSEEASCLSKVAKHSWSPRMHVASFIGHKKFFAYRHFCHRLMGRGMNLFMLPYGPPW
jgi:hypothetical protein